MGKLLRRLAVLLRWHRFETELDAELQFHRDMAGRELETQGLKSSEARASVNRTFGNAGLARNDSRDVWMWPGLQDVTQDIRFAARLLVKDRRFTLVVLLVLGLGIGINNMLFTILNAHTIRGLPIDQPDRVLYISTVDNQNRPRGVSFPDLEDLKTTTQTFSAIAAFVNAPVTIGEEGRAPERVDGAYLTANAFDVIQTLPLAGRTLLPEDDRRGAFPVVLLGNSLWQTRYGGRPEIVGQSIRVNGSPLTVIGIISDRSGLPSTAQAWLPLFQMPDVAAERRDVRTLRVFGRVRDGVDSTNARTEVEGILERLERDHPQTNRNIRARVVPINEQFLGRLSDPAWRAFISVGFLVLAISCANVANLFLDHSVVRTREIAIRTALGATRPRVVRQLLIEASVLAAISAIVGLAIAATGVRLFRGLIPDNVLPYWFDYSIDGRVLGMLVGVSVATVLVFGLIPAISGSKTDVNRALKDNREIGSGGTRRWTAVFLTAEFALAVVMLAQIALGLRLSGPELPSDAPIDTPEVLTAALTLSGDKYRTPDQRAAFFARLQERLDTIPGVLVASISNVLPLGGGREREIEIAGQARTDPPRRALTVGIGPGSFRTFSLAMFRGREFVTQDLTAGQTPVIVNERAARVFWGEQDAIGQRMAFPSTEPTDASLEWLTVVGVAPDIRQQPRPRVLGAWETDPIVYVPYAAFPPDTATLLLRSNVDAGTLAPTVRSQLLELDPNVPLYRVRTMAGVIDDGGWNSRVSNVLINVLAFIAVTLATVGLYAVTAHRVHRRTPELGLRMALGAERRHITRLIIRSVLMQVSVGFIVGVACTAVWARLFWTSAERGLVAVESLAMVGAVLIVLAVGASLVPVFRATRIDPVAALRYE
jgi:putative ABC transport system permease protein